MSMWDVSASECKLYAFAYVDGHATLYSLHHSKAEAQNGDRADFV